MRIKCFVVAALFFGSVCAMEKDALEMKARDNSLICPWVASIAVQERAADIIKAAKTLPKKEAMAYIVRLLEAYQSKEQELQRTYSQRGIACECVHTRASKQ